MKTIGNIKEGRLFKDQETSAYYYVRGSYNKASGRYRCTAYRCKDHSRYNWADMSLLKSNKVLPYSPESDLRVYNQ